MRHFTRNIWKIESEILLDLHMNDGCEIRAATQKTILTTMQNYLNGENLSEI